MMKAISAQSAAKLSKILIAKLGTPEGGSPACDIYGTTYESTWRYRRDDGTSWSKLGFGPTRKMVTLREFIRKNGEKVYSFSVYICK